MPRKSKHVSIPIFVPEAACPHQCVFCNQKKISGQAIFPSIDSIHQTIQEHLKTIPKNTRTEIAFFGGNFTGIDFFQQKELLETVQPYVREGRVSSIRLSTRPDYIKDENLELLKKYGVKTIELGAQSLDEEVLSLSSRGHSVQDVEIASKKILESGFTLGLQMMLGLPGDNREKSIFTAKKIIELGAVETRIYPTLVVKDTELAKLFLEKKYQPLKLDETVNCLADIIPLFEAAHVKILRVGLHGSDGFKSGSDLLAGPFHVNLKEMALTEIWNRKFTELFKKKGQVCEIQVNPKEHNFAIGFQRRNKKILEENFKQVSFIPDSTLIERDFYADCR